MNNSSVKVNSFKDLIPWQEGHQLTLDIYKATETFPQHQQFSLTSQIQRAAISIVSNIAEGFARRSDRDQVHFLYIALGSTNEIQSQLLIAKDLGYISEAHFEILDQRSVLISKLINGLIKSNKSRQL